MSFGYSIGDFIALAELTWKIYDRCKKSAAEFRDLSREVSSMHFVLKAIEEAWGANDLAPYQRYELSNLVEGCREVLRDLERKLDKYESLGSNWKSPLDRFRWAAEDIAPIRVKLMHNAVYLSTFNATLASHSHGDRIRSSEARVLQKLNELQLECQEGKRAAPAFSLVTVETLDKEETWQNIVTELQTKDIDTQAISTNQGYIRNWIDQVILADDDASADHISANTNENRQYLVAGMNEQHLSAMMAAQTAAFTTASLNYGSESAQTERPRSAASHRSKDSTWRPVDEPNLPYVQSLLTKLFNLRYKDDEILIMKRIYHQLDWRDRGYLYRTDIERCCIEASKETKILIDHIALMKLVASFDSNRDGRIHRDEFIQICGKLLDFAKGEQEKVFQDLVRNSNLRGGKETRLGREALALEKSEFLPLPFDWVIIKSSEGEVEYLNTTTGFVSKQKPAQDPRTFSCMAFTAARILVPSLIMALEQMNHKHFADEYLQSCESVLEIASAFALLEGESGPAELSDLDTLLAIFYSSRLKERITLLPSSYSKLQHIQDMYYALLRDIQGFACSLWRPEPRRGLRLDHCVSSNLSGPSMWEGSFAKRRVNIIEDQARSFKDFAAVIHECRQWRKLRGTLEEFDTESRLALKDLRTSQIQNSKDMSRPTFFIEKVTVTGFRKRTFRSPHVYLRIFSFGSGGERKLIETSSRPAESEVSWDDMSQVFDSDYVTLKLFDAKNKTLITDLQVTDVYAKLTNSPNDGLHCERLNLYGKAFTNNKGYLSITFNKIKQTSLDQSAFITGYPCPPGWENKADENGPYFFNVKSGQLTGVLPPRALTRRPVAVPTESDFDMNGMRLPKGWTRKYGSKGIVNYFNTITEATQQSTPLYQGEATSYSLTGHWDVGAAKPNKSDFQFFETVLESYNDFGRQENDTNVGLLWGGGTSTAALVSTSLLAPGGAVCTVQ